MGTLGPYHILLSWACANYGVQDQVSTINNPKESHGLYMTYWRLLIITPKYNELMTDFLKDGSHFKSALRTKGYVSHFNHTFSSS